MHHILITMLLFINNKYQKVDPNAHHTIKIFKYLFFLQKNVKKKIADIF